MSYSEYKAYMDMFKPKHIIKEADELTLDDLNDAANEVEQEKEEQPAEEQQPKKQPVQSKPQLKPQSSASTKQTNNGIDMKFSVDLATEFSNTINEFTTICAQIVEKRVINKELSDRFYDIYAKIKNLADAASKTE